MSQLSKSIVHNQVSKLAEQYGGLASAPTPEQRARALSQAFALLCVMQLLEIDADDAYDAVVDGSNDMGIDAIWVEEPQNEYFNVHLFQTQYSAKLEHDKGFPESEVVKLIATLRSLLLRKRYSVNNALDLRLSQVRAHVDEFNIPNFIVYLCNNGLGLAHNAQAHIDAFVAESPENAKRYRFVYVNHADLLRASERAEPVNCGLDFVGGFVDEAINFKRAFVGKVQVSQIADLLNQHQERLLGHNVRDFLGFRRIVNHGIRTTLLDEARRKDFYFLNNGITFVCEKLDYAQGPHGVRARLSNAQIINGGQTSRTIQSVVQAAPGLDFSQSHVLVRAYQVQMSDESELIQDIITATNSQNPILARDLHANDGVQRALELGLRHYGIRYLRRRDARRAKPEDIRMEFAAECLVSVCLRKPVDARYRKSLHFTPEFYPELFDPQRVTPELVWFATALCKKIESRRKHPAPGLQERYPFLPLASHFLLILVYDRLVRAQALTRANIHAHIEALQSASFDTHYHAALEHMAQALAANWPAAELDAYTLTQRLRDPRFCAALLRPAAA